MFLLFCWFIFGMMENAKFFVDFFQSILQLLVVLFLYSLC